MRHLGLTTALAGACAVLVMSATVTVKPIFIKIPDIDGEAASGDHEDWIEIHSVSMAGESRGGVNVAAGDVDGDGRAEAEDASRSSGQGGGAGKVQMAQSQGRQGDQGNQAPVRGVAARGPDPVPIGLLLPAVQKARTMVVERHGRSCEVGRALGTVEIREEPEGKNGRILDATVSHCSPEQISLNFTKIEWD